MADMFPFERSRLLAAMTEIVALRGYRAASVAQVSAHAGVSVEAFHECFEDNEQCVLAAFDDVVLRASVRVFDACCDEPTWGERVAAGVLALLEFLDDQPLCARFAVVEALGATRAVARARSEILARLAALVDSGRRHAHPLFDLSPLTADAAVWNVLGVIHESLLSASPLALVELAGPLTSLLVFPYLGEEAACRELASATLTCRLSVPRDT